MTRALTTAVNRVCVVQILQKEHDGRWYLMLAADDNFPEDGVISISDDRILGMIGLNKSIVRYLSEVFAKIEDQLPEEG